MWWFIFLVTFFGKSLCLGTVIIVRDADCDDPCFRRLLSGKRIADPYVKRVMECERIHDCHRMCEYERGFTCEGFNYRPRANAKGMCELASMPPNRVDVNRDFISDPRYDYYERDWTRQKCEPQREKNHPRPSPGIYSGNSGWWGDQRPNWGPPRRPVGQYIPESTSTPSTVTAGHIPYGGTFVEHTGVSFGAARPIDHNRRPDTWFRPGANEIPRPTHPPPLPVRPLEDSWTDLGHGEERRTPIMSIPHRYLPSRPLDQGYSGNGYSYGVPGEGNWRGGGGRRGESYPVRRVGYNPDPETNEIPHQYLPDRRKSRPHHEGYGPSYVDGYPAHHGPPDAPMRPIKPEPPYVKTPPEHDSYYGQFYNYGGAYGYSSRGRPPKISRAHPPVPMECSIRSAGGFRLARGIIRKGYLTTNLEQCEQLCQGQKEFACLTFAYRYTLAATSPADNCLLSDSPFDDLVFYTDLEPDRDYDIYAMTTNPKWCEARAKSSSNARRPHPPDECFWRVRSGFGMPPSVVKKPTRVDGMGECQVECVRAKDFTCRSFVFRYESHSVSGLPNCYLSDWPAVELDPHKMQDMDGAELYERGSFGRGCEPHHPIPSPDLPALDYKPSRPDEASCYAGYDRPCKLTPYAIILTAKVDSEAECRKTCTVMRQNVAKDGPTCMSFSYKISDSSRGDNCHISDVSTRDLRPGLDYAPDEDYSLHVFKELEPRCLLSSDFYRPNYDPPTSAPRPSHSDKPYANPEEPYYYEPPHKPFNTGLNPHDERFFFPPELTIFNHYTVNGNPCKRGTKCERNPVAGFWSCQSEDADADSWEYCCEPSHQCGFSAGFNYPWCYVGAAGDQWRPCSERYFPYTSKPTSVKPSRPVPRPHFVKCEYEVDCAGRHWPVAVLHGEAPPNGTDSVALANNHPEYNDSKHIRPSLKSLDEERNNASPSGGNLKKRRTEEVIDPVRVRLIDRANKSEAYRANSRFKPVHNANSSIANFLRASRNDTPAQFFITKRLNAGLSTLGEGARNKPTVAKIERIQRPRGVELETARIVVGTSSKDARAPAPSQVEVLSAPAAGNASTVNQNSTRSLVTTETIESGRGA